MCFCSLQDIFVRVCYLFIFLCDLIPLLTSTHMRTNDTGGRPVTIRGLPKLLEEIMTKYGLTVQ